MNATRDEVIGALPTSTSGEATHKVPVASYATTNASASSHILLLLEVIHVLVLGRRGSCFVRCAIEILTARAEPRTHTRREGSSSSFPTNRFAHALRGSS